MLLVGVFLLSACMGQFAKKPPRPATQDADAQASESYLPQCGSEHDIITCDWGKEEK